MKCPDEAFVLHHTHQNFLKLCRRQFYLASGQSRYWWLHLRRLCLGGSQLDLLLLDVHLLLLQNLLLLLNSCMHLALLLHHLLDLEV